MDSRKLQLTQRRKAMKFLTRMPSLQNGYRFAGFIGRGTTHPLTRSHLVLVTLRIPHRGRYYIVHIERDIVVFDCHPELTIPSYGGSADFNVEYVVRESATSNEMQLKIQKEQLIPMSKSPRRSVYNERLKNSTINR